MHTFINSPLQIGTLTLPNRLIQGPLAGYSCAPFRSLFYQFTPPAYCVSEMSSAQDVIHKHTPHSRYLYRALLEKILAYQLSGNNEYTLAQAALRLQTLGADLIDINCGCPKAKIRKKGAGSALLEEPQKLVRIIKKVREVLSIPLTIKIRIQGNVKDLIIAKHIEDAGADALIVHGRRWTDDYDTACDLRQMAQIKSSVTIPVIANGDIHDLISLKRSMELSNCDGFMIARAGSGRPWLYQELLEQRHLDISFPQKIRLFMTHLEGLVSLEDEFKAVLQSRSLVKYYFREQFNEQLLNSFYRLSTLADIEHFLQEITMTYTL